MFDAAFSDIGDLPSGNYSVSALDVIFFAKDTGFKWRFDLQTPISLLRMSTLTSLCRETTCNIQKLLHTLLRTFSYVAHARSPDPKYNMQ